MTLATTECSGLTLTTTSGLAATDLHGDKNATVTGISHSSLMSMRGTMVETSGVVWRGVNGAPVEQRTNRAHLL